MRHGMLIGIPVLIMAVIMIIDSALSDSSQLWHLAIYPRTAQGLVGVRSSLPRACRRGVAGGGGAVRTLLLGSLLLKLASVLRSRLFGFIPIRKRIFKDIASRYHVHAVPIHHCCCPFIAAAAFVTARCCCVHHCTLLLRSQF